jgi:hypothetical protein
LLLGGALIVKNLSLLKNLTRMMTGKFIVGSVNHEKVF